MWCFFFRSLVRRQMPRRRWLPAPDGWVQIIRGPHPPSAKWPAASAGHSTTKQQGDVGGVSRSQARGRWRQPPAHVSSEVSFEAAQRRVAQLEGALRAFGDSTGPEVVSEVCETCSTGSPCGQRHGTIGRRPAQQGVGPGQNITVMPTLIPRELAQWTEDRRADLQVRSG